jgi:hypothetical protein
LTGNPVYLAVAVVLALIILFGVIKKHIKLNIIRAAILVLDIDHMVWAGKEIPKSLHDVQQTIQDTVEKGKEKGGQILEKKVGEKIDQVFDKE